MKEQIIKILKNGGIGVLATDTLYGLVGSALSRKAVERIYKVRQRKPNKPMIILIGSLKDLNLFNIKVNNKLRKLLIKFWPGKVSIILPCRSKKFAYLHPVRSNPAKRDADVLAHRTSNGVHRGTKTLAFRLPAKKSLVNLLKKVGPLVAPSANIEGEPPAKTILEAKKYFGKTVDFYVKGRRLSGPASTLIQIKNNDIVILRKGAGKI